MSSGAAHNNSKVFRVFKRKLANRGTFVEVAQKFGIWLADDRAYYAEARPEIVSLLATAELLMRQEANLDTHAAFHISLVPPSPLTASFQYLVGVAWNHRHLFAEQDLQAQLDRIANTCFGDATNLRVPAASTSAPPAPVVAQETQSVPTPKQPPKKKRKASNLASILKEDEEYFQSKKRLSNSVTPAPSVEEQPPPEQPVATPTEDKQRTETHGHQSGDADVENISQLQPTTENQDLRAQSPATMAISALSPINDPISDFENRPDDSVLPDDAVPTGYTSKPQTGESVLSNRPDKVTGVVSIDTVACDSRVRIDVEPTASLAAPGSEAADAEQDTIMEPPDVTGPDSQHAGVDKIDDSKPIHMEAGSETANANMELLDMTEPVSQCAGVEEIIDTEPIHVVESGSEPPDAAEMDVVESSSQHVEVEHKTSKEPTNSKELAPAGAEQITNLVDTDGEKLGSQPPDIESTVPLADGSSGADHAPISDAPAEPASDLTIIDDSRVHQAPVGTEINSGTPSDQLLSSTVHVVPIGDQQAISTESPLKEVANTVHSSIDQVSSSMQVAAPFPQANVEEPQVTLLPDPSQITTLSNLGGSQPVGLFEGVMAVISLKPGTSTPGTTHIELTLTESQFTLLTKWKDRRKHTENVSKALCISFAIYCKSDLQAVAKLYPKDTLITVLVKCCRPIWPKKGGLLLSCNNYDTPLSPPWNVSQDNLVDVGSRLNQGKNDIKIIQEHDMSKYVFTLHAHHPTATQLAQLEETRKMEQLWKEKVAFWTRPFDITLPSFNFEV